MVEFLQLRVHSATHSNVLEDFIYVSHISLEYIAMMRANAIIDLRISRPLRWLSGNTSQLIHWSPFSLGPVLDSLENVFERTAKDGHVLLDPGLDIWKPTADAQPKFREYVKHMYETETVLSPNGKTKHLQVRTTQPDLPNPNLTELTLSSASHVCSGNSH